MSREKIVAAYRARLAMANQMVGEPETSTADVDGLTIAVEELKLASTPEAAAAKKAEYTAQRDQAISLGDKHTARGLAWVVMALSRLEQEYAIQEPAHV